mmetsp:Transcript_33503/g.38151  ORF Transcript_33503/g.38151 Transcript_33503/m.38151 type:complete len:95 (-) Transcript_33503:282-566(-)
MSFRSFTVYVKVTFFTTKHQSKCFIICSGKKSLVLAFFSLSLEFARNGITVADPHSKFPSLPSVNTLRTLSLYQVCLADDPPLWISAPVKMVTN